MEPEAEFLDEIQTKVFRVFLLAINSHLYSLFLQAHTTSYNFCKGERKKTWYKTIPPSLWFKKSIQKPPVWELSRLSPNPSKKLYFHEFGFCSQNSVGECNQIHKILFTAVTEFESKKVRLGLLSQLENFVEFLKNLEDPIDLHKWKIISITGSHKKETGKRK